MIKRRDSFKYLFSINLGLLLAFSKPFLIAAQATSIKKKRTQAQLLTQTGEKYLNEGRASEALQAWQLATQIYRQIGYQEGIIGSLTNESLALQYLGLYTHACSTLLKALKLDEDSSIYATFLEPSTDSNVNTVLLTTAINKQKPTQAYLIGLQNLGDVLRIIGKPDLSYTVLRKAFEIVQNLPSGSEASSIRNQLLLSIANTERSLYHQAKNKYQLTDEPGSKQNALVTAKLKLQSALNLYQDLSTARQSGTFLQAQINQLNLLLEIEKWSHLTKENAQAITTKQSLQLLVTLLTEQVNFSQLSPIESVYIRLNLAESLIKIEEDEQLKQLMSSKKNLLLIALSNAKAALSLAQELDNKRAKSYALGTIGKICNSLGQEFESQKYLEQATGLAQSVQAVDIAYQWQWQLGRLYQRRNNFSKATKAYAAAINSLDQVRGNILSVNPEFQWEFKEKVESVYQEYMELLLSQKQADLKQVVTTQEKLKVAELEAFLQCSKLPRSSVIKNNSSDLQPIIYLIKLKNRAEVIVRTQHGYYHHTLNLQLLSNSMESLNNGFQNREITKIKADNLLVYSQNIYNLIFLPVKQYLPKTGNLIFALDTYFQNLPIGILHDGQKYLINDYSISIALGSDFLQTQPSKNSKLLSKVLIAGIYEKSPNFFNSLISPEFQSLPEVKIEIANIKKTAASALVLANSAFTSNKFHQKIEENSFTVIHLSTHGQFSSDPEKTFLMAWDRLINVKELKFLIKNEHGIDLLTLSACQTAKGDRRSALGIAGITVQAGAKSTLASLWLVETNSTALLMSYFYEGLNQGMTKAEALRQAQLKLMSNPKYSHPYFWSGFILVGNGN